MTLTGSGQDVGVEALDAFFARTPRLAVAFSGGCTADKPSFSCIAVHVGEGRPITAAALAETAERLGVADGRRP